jgi:hypothetical protein
LLARIIADLARILREVGLAEELAQDALAGALDQWPESGIPVNTGRLAHGRREASLTRNACDTEFLLNLDGACAQAQPQRGPQQTFIYRENEPPPSDQPLPGLFNSL